MISKPYVYDYTRSYFLIALICYLLLTAVPSMADRNDLKNSVDRANAFILEHQIAAVDTTCCLNPGDFDHDGRVSIADAVKFIYYIFANGEKPVCPYEADVNGDCRIDIGDVIAMIRPIFNIAPWPDCAPESCEYIGFD